MALGKILGWSAACFLGVVGCSSGRRPSEPELEQHVSFRRQPVLPGTWVWGEDQRLGNGVVGDLFGYSVALSGTTAVVGSWPSDGHKGPVRVYVRGAANWTLQQTLNPNEVAADEPGFGHAVAIDGDTIVVSANDTQATGRGVIWVFVRNGSTWSEQQKIPLDPGQTSNSAFGWSVSVSGNTLLAGAPSGAYASAAYVYVRSGSSWSFQQKLEGTGPVWSTMFGWSVKVQGDTALIGAFNDTGPGEPNTGRAYVFVRQSGTWSLQRTFEAPGGVQGNTFGMACDLSGETALIAAPQEADLTGAAYAYVRSGTAWSLQQRIAPPIAVKHNLFGYGLALDGNTAMIGNPSFGDAVGDSAIVFTRSGSTWTEQQTIEALDDDAHSGFGRGLAVNGTFAIAGAPYNSGNRGTAYIFRLALSNGSGCTLDSECSSKHCVDGVCCESVCNGACESCSSAETGREYDGVCAPIADGLDPDAECTAGPACGAPGVCDGAGSCRSAAVEGAACGATTCADAAHVQGAICDGSGQCQSGEIAACAPYRCAGSACTTTCANNGQCSADAFCTNAHTCRLKLLDGGECTAATQCKSGNCVDGVCCNTGCAGACQACTALKKGSGRDGVCAPIAADSDPDDECSTVPDDWCGAPGVCNGSGQCRQQATLSHACGSTICTDGEHVEGALCDTAGQCASDAVSCSPYRCSNTTCTTSCTVDADCATGAFCTTSHTCQTKKPISDDCRTSNECANDQCVDGVCCNSACLGQCEACSAEAKGTGVDGVCGPIVSGCGASGAGGVGTGGGGAGGVGTGGGGAGGVGTGGGGAGGGGAGASGSGNGGTSAGASGSGGVGGGAGANGAGGVGGDGGTGGFAGAAGSSGENAGGTDASGGSGDGGTSPEGGAAGDASTGGGSSGGTGSGGTSGGTAGSVDAGNTGGVESTGGLAGASGAQNPSGGSTAGMPSGESTADSNDSGGCGCNAVGERSDPFGAACILLAASVFAFVRRRYTARDEADLGGT